MENFQDGSKSVEEATIQGWDLIEAAWTMITGAFCEVDEILGEHGMGYKSLIVLAVLERADTPQALAAQLQAPAPTISRLLRGLEEAEMISRTISSQDRRRFHLQRTAKGDEVLSVGMKVINGAMGQKIAGFSREDQETLARSLPLLRSLVSVPQPKE